MSPSKLVCQVNYLVFVFVEQEMDGIAVVQIFGTYSGPDCLKEIIGKFGLRVKVYTAIKTRLERDMRSGDMRVGVGIWTE